LRGQDVSNWLTQRRWPFQKGFGFYGANAPHKPKKFGFHAHYKEEAKTGDHFKKAVGQLQDQFFLRNKTFLLYSPFLSLQIAIFKKVISKKNKGAVWKEHPGSPFGMEKEVK